MTSHEQTPHGDTEKGPDMQGAPPKEAQPAAQATSQQGQADDLATSDPAERQKSEFDLPDPDFARAVNDSAKQAGIDPDQADKLTRGLLAYLAQAAEKQSAQRQQGIEELKGLWKETFDTKVSTAVNAVRAFGGQDFVDFLNQTGLGDHPAMICTFYAIGRALAEDSFSQGQPGTQRRGPERTEGGLPLLSFPSMK